MHVFVSGPSRWAVTSPPLPANGGSCRGGRCFSVDRGGPGLRQLRARARRNRCAPRWRSRGCRYSQFAARARQSASSPPSSASGTRRSGIISAPPSSCTRSRRSSINHRDCGACRIASGDRVHPHRRSRPRSIARCLPSSAARWSSPEARGRDQHDRARRPAGDADLVGFTFWRPHGAGAKCRVAFVRVSRLVAPLQPGYV